MPPLRGVDRGAARPFVGRERERALLSQLLRAATRGQPSLVVVSGPAGVGKTALLRWLLQRAVVEGLRTIRHSCSAPFAGAGLLVPTGRPAPGPAPGLAPAVDDEADLRAAEERAAALRTETVRRFLDAARRRPIVFTLDDGEDAGLSWEQAVTPLLSALDEQAVTGYAGALVAIATRIPIEPGSVVDHALRLDIARDLPLVGLSRDEVTDLVTAAGADPSSFPELHDDTAGLPLLVEASIESGPQGLRVRTLAEAMTRRLDKVDWATHEILTVAAHVGRSWSAAELARLVDRPIMQVEDAHRAAAEAHLVDADDGSRWQFSHPVVRSHLIEALGPGASAAIHVQIAERMPRTGDGAVPADALIALAHHLVAAGALANPVEVAEIGDRAGRAAYGSGLWEEAALLLGAAAEAATEEPALAQAIRHHAAGRASYMATDPDRAELHLARAHALARLGGDDDLALEAATLLSRARLGERPLALGRPVDISELITSLDVPGPSASATVLGTAMVTEALLVTNQSDQALALVEKARSRDLAFASDLAIGALDFGEGIHRLRRLELGRASECFTEAEQRAERADDALDEIAAATRRHLVGLMMGDVRGAAAGARVGMQRAVDHSLPGEAALAGALVALAETLGGDPHAPDAIEHAARLHRRGRLHWAAELLVPVAAALGARLGRSVTGPWRLDDVTPSSAVLALTSVESGDDDLLRTTIATASWRRGFRGEPTLGTLPLLVALVESGDRIGDATLVAAAEAALREVSNAGVTVVIGWPALVPRLEATVARWADRLDDAHRHLDHAVQVCRRERLPAEMARVELELALVADREGAPAAQVGAHLRTALTSFDALGMLGWVARCEQTAQELSLPPVIVDDLAPRERTLLTTDIVGSTEVNARLGDAFYLEQLRVHDRLLRSRLREWRGTEIKHTGDGINAVFDDPGHAARCALTFQDDLLRWAQDEPDLALTARCGIATGVALASGGDFYGLLQSEAARLCAEAARGEVLATSRSAAGLRADGELVATSLGHRALRGIPEPVEILRIRRRG